MLRNFVKIAIRNFWRFRIYTAINLAGMALGLSVGILILLFVVDELSYDRFHSKAERIFKITTDSATGDGMETNAWPIAHKLKTEFPEVESVLYTRRASSNMMINHKGQRHEHTIYYAGEEFFNIFSFPLLQGNSANALKDPFSIVITEEIKNRYFGNDMALGQTLILRDSLEFTVTGVVENVPSQSHIQFDILASFSTFEKLATGFSYTEGWGNFNVRNYILLTEGAGISQIESRARNLYMDNVGDWLQGMGVELYVNFIPLREIYLRSEVHNGFGPKGSIDQIYLVSGIAIFVILLAIINFINITTARGVYRAKEVGLRKIAGSSRPTMIWQFLIESFILTILSFALAIAVVDFALPFFNSLMGKEYYPSSLLSGPTLLGILALVVTVSFLSGYYPAFVLSGYKPAEVLKGRMQTGQKGVKLRRFLVVFQFLISTTLVLATLLVLKQLNYMRNKNLGFDMEQILVLDATNVPRSAPHEFYKNYLKGLTYVEDVSFTNALPGRPGWQGQWAYPEGFPEGEQVTTEYMAIDEDYIGTLGLELIAGRNFEINRIYELDEGLIINETSVREMGWNDPENAIGKRIISPSKRPHGTVIGVVKDYHGLGLQQQIWPKVMDYSSQSYGRYYAIRFTTGHTSELIEKAKEAWLANLGDYEFEYFFLDEDFDRQYRAEDRLIGVFIIFGILAMFIAGIGLLGLVSFMVLSRMKEIGVRKVLGASAFNIAGLLSKEFISLVIIANVIAFPLVWYFGSRWIENFAYHTTITPAIFLATLLITILLAVITVSFQTIRAAVLDPVDTLRNE